MYKKGLWHPDYLINVYKSPVSYRLALLTLLSLGGNRERSLGLMPYVSTICKCWSIISTSSVQRSNSSSSPFTLSSRPLNSSDNLSFSLCLFDGLLFLFPSRQCQYLALIAAITRLSTTPPHLSHIRSHPPSRVTSRCLIRVTHFLQEAHQSPPILHQSVCDVFTSQILCLKLH